MDNSALLVRARKGDTNARNELVKNNSALVWSIARRFINRGHDLEDIYQIGCIGMIKAINRFDTSFNVRFSTYAVPMIIGEIQKFLRDDGLIKVSRSLKELSVKALRCREKFINEFGTEPSVSEIAELTGSDKDSIIMALEVSLPGESIDRKRDESDGGGYIIDKITYDLDTGDTTIDSLALKIAVSELPSDDRKLIQMRYFEGKTQRETAEYFNISQVQISRREKRILSILKEKLEY